MNLTQRNTTGNIRMLLSVTCIAVCVLLLLLWVRSYWWIDMVTGPQSGEFRPQIGSSNGWLTLRYRNSQLSTHDFPEWHRQSRTFSDMEKIYQQIEEKIKNEHSATFVRPTPTYRFGWVNAEVFRTPIWIPAIVSGCLAILFGWKQDWRFSLRTILIVTAVIAAVLSVSVSFLRMP